MCVTLDCTPDLQPVSLAVGMREHPPIAVCDLADQMETLSANENLHFSQEYEVI